MKSDYCVLRGARARSREKETGPFLLDLFSLPSDNLVLSARRDLHISLSGR